MSPESIDVFAEYPAPMVWLAGPNGNVEYYDAPLLAYLGLAAREIKGWNWQWAIHPSDLRRVSRAWSCSVQTGAPFRVACRLRRADGAYLWHAGTASPLQDPERPGRWFGTWAALDAEQTPDAAHAGSEAELALC